MSESDFGFGRSFNIFLDGFGPTISYSKFRAFFDPMGFWSTTVKANELCVSLCTYISDTQRTSGMQGTLLSAIHNDKYLNSFSPKRFGHF